MYNKYDETSRNVSKRGATRNFNVTLSYSTEHILDPSSVLYAQVDKQGVNWAECIRSGMSYRASDGLEVRSREEEARLKDPQKHG